MTSTVWNEYGDEYNKACSKILNVGSRANAGAEKSPHS